MHLSYSTATTPIGVALAVASEAGLRTLDFLDDDVPRDVPLVREGVPVIRDDDALADVFAQLGEYFDGRRRTFDLALDLNGIHGFTRTALEAIRDIPYGAVASYGEVAVMAGAPRAARAVGTACARTPVSVVIPAHRVVRSDGSLGEYGGRPDVKRFLLDLEAGAS